MKMFFGYDDKVTIAKDGGTSLEVRKQEISDFLIKKQINMDKLIERSVRQNGRAYPQDGIEIIEKAVILSNLKQIDVIELREEGKYIVLYPIKIEMEISEGIWNFLNSKLNT